MLELQNYIKKFKAEQRLASEQSNDVESEEPEAPAADRQFEASLEEADGKEEQKPTPLADHKCSPPTPSASANPEGTRSRKRTAEEPTPKDEFESPQRKRPKEGTPPDVIIASD